MASAASGPASDRDWPFDQGPHVAVITVRSVLDGDPILSVTHDEDDDGWQFLDGRDLSPGWVAWRAGPAMPWQRRPRG